MPKFVKVRFGLPLCRITNDFCIGADRMGMCKDSILKEELDCKEIPKPKPMHTFIGYCPCNSLVTDADEDPCAKKKYDCHSCGKRLTKKEIRKKLPEQSNEYRWV